MKVKELQEKYNLKSRQSLYDRLKALSLTLKKDQLGHGFASPEDIELLDQLDTHLASGGTLANFTPVQSVSTEMVNNLVPVFPTLDSTYLLVRILEKIEQHLALWVSPNPLYPHEVLEKAHEKNWHLTTDRVSQLIGVRPKGEIFIRGNWTFHKVGRIGRCAAWKIEKADLDLSRP